MRCDSAPVVERLSVTEAVCVRGGVISAERLLAGLCIPSVAPSLGSVETLITLPARTSHAGMTAEDRCRIGVTEDLVRVSCGIEDADDLIADFGRALEEAAGVEMASSEGVCVPAVRSRRDS